jgi:hypothetical protein
VVKRRPPTRPTNSFKRHSSLQLLITDVETPEILDGFDLARVVAEQWPHICVIVASGAATPGLTTSPKAQGSLQSRFPQNWFTRSSGIIAIHLTCRIQLPFTQGRITDPLPRRIPDAYLFASLTSVRARIQPLCRISRRASCSLICFWYCGASFG